jgi:hypothetical protein
VYHSHSGLVLGGQVDRADAVGEDAQIVIRSQLQIVF